MNKRQLFENIKRKKSFLCVGLDTDIKKIPEHLKSADDPIFAFNKAIIDARPTSAWPTSPTWPSTRVWA